jgi:hypothetical protein
MVLLSGYVAFSVVVVAETCGRRRFEERRLSAETTF